jgi:hypothetical protein
MDPPMHRRSNLYQANIAFNMGQQKRPGLLRLGGTLAALSIFSSGELMSSIAGLGNLALAADGDLSYNGA